MKTALIFGCCFLFTVVARDGLAQPVQKLASARVEVIDSIGNGALPGAFVVVIGANRSDVADDLGRALVDSILPGIYSLEVMHPLLDSLGIRLTTPERAFTGGDTARISISLPTPLGVSRLKCPGFRSNEEGALTGFVTEANGVADVPDATVTVTWMETSISKDVGVRNSRVIRNAKTGLGGRFVICGVPTQVSAQMVATEGNRATSPVPLVISGSHFSVQSLAFPERGDTAISVTSVRGTIVGRVGRASVSGLVRGPDSRPVVGAVVAISGGLSFAETDSSGRFVLGGAPSGTQTLQVRKLGYEGFQQALSLLPGQTRQVEVSMESFVPVLSNVTITALRDSAINRIGFTKRKLAGFGYFVTPEEIERRNPIRASDLLREVPMLRITYEQNKARVSGRQIGMGRNCLIYVVDGVQWRESIDDFIMPQEVGAIEVYSANKLPIGVPGAYNAEGCEMVIIWTKAKLLNP